MEMGDLLFTVCAYVLSRLIRHSIVLYGTALFVNSHDPTDIHTETNHTHT